MNNIIKDSVIERKQLDFLIEKSQESGDWSRVENADVSEITDMSSLFYGIKGIKDLDLSSWDTSNVADMKSMFESSDFNTPLNFDTSNVDNMSYMFADSVYNHPLHFDTLNVITMEGMFAYSKYNQPLHFNTSNVEDMLYMFRNSKYNQTLDFDTSNVEDMYLMFEDSSFNQDISEWVILDTEENEDVIKYRDECIKIKKDKEAIEEIVEKNNGESGSCCGFKL